VSSFDYRSRVAVVTGASSGIGRQVALDLAKQGASLVIAARRRALLDDVADQCRATGAEVEAMTGDLAERPFAESVIARVLVRFGRLDILVNNAGIPKHKQFFDVTPDDIDYTMRINLLAPAYMTLAALKPMLRQGEGYIINISSGAGRIAPPRETVYAASKFALSGFTEGLWNDIAGSNIHAAVIHVGPIDTEIWDKAASEAPVRYRGKKYPPSVISRAVLECIEKRRHEMTVPKSLWWVFFLKLLLPGMFRRGAARWDPVTPDVVELARRRAAEASDRNGGAIPKLTERQ
jgi:short-subunit dehydrogenase